MRRWRRILTLICVIGLMVGVGQMNVCADTKETKQFTGEIELSRQDETRYVMQVTVGNQGENFDGTVRVSFTGVYGDTCAYETQLSLPEQGEKKFLVHVPVSVADPNNGYCYISFVDEKGHILETASQMQKKLFRDSNVSGIHVGVLSDDIDSLSYLKMGGNLYDIGSFSGRIELDDLTDTDISAALDGIYFLVIDNFDVSSLEKKEIDAIEGWVKRGGWLLLGTGANVERTMSGFDMDFLQASAGVVVEAGDATFPNAQFPYIGQEYWYEAYQAAGIDLTQATLATIMQNGNLYYEDGANPGELASIESGAILIMNLALNDPQMRKADSNVVYGMYDSLAMQSSSYQRTSYGSINYRGGELFSIIDRMNTNVDFGWLKGLILVYVVLVGPVLYVILRKCRHSEWYWGAAPILGIVFIAGVFLFGKGARLNHPKVYEVTMQRADADQKETFLEAYQSGLRPWTLELKEEYDLAGSGNNDYGANVTNNGKDYHYLVKNDGNRIQVGIKPIENFDNGFLYAAGTAKPKGSLTIEQAGAADDSGQISGVVRNETGEDLTYLLVKTNNDVKIIKDVKAGETVDLSKTDRSRVICEYIGVDLDEAYSNLCGYYGGNVDDDYRNDDMAALFMGSMNAEARAKMDETIVVCGLVKGYESALDQKMKQISYGCIYEYGRMEEGNAAN